MRVLLAFISILFFNVTIAQQSGNPEVKTSMNGDITVEGTDLLGAKVLVVYDYNYNKIYQERTLNGEVTFAKYNKNGLIEYGTIVKPILADSEPGRDHFQVK